MLELPDAFQQRLQKLFSAPVREKILDGMRTERATSFRINTLLSERQSVLADLDRQGLHPQSIDWLPDSFFVPAAERRQLTDSTSCQNGHLYIQNPASMLPPIILDPRPGEKILDLCAAPGSKTLQMAAMMRNDGWISAVEVVKNRFFRLRANIERHGASIVHTYHRDGTKVWRYVPEEFDRVLLDAPCSSEGQFSTSEPNSYRFWNVRKNAEMARKQKKLLFSALHCLKPGGTLVYSTCTLAPEENEAIIDDLLKKSADRIDVLPIPIRNEIMLPALSVLPQAPYSSELHNAVRILPDGLSEGFFVCKLKKH